MVISSNTSNIEYEKLNNEDKIKFQNTLRNSMIYLAKEVVRDGEGIKIYNYKCSRFKKYARCQKAAFCIANSNLVKTALFAEDPNWGRVVLL